MCPDVARLVSHHQEFFRHVNTPRAAAPPACVNQLIVDFYPDPTFPDTEFVRDRGSSLLPASTPPRFSSPRVSLVLKSVPLRSLCCRAPRLETTPLPHLPHTSTPSLSAAICPTSTSHLSFPPIDTPFSLSAGTLAREPTAAATSPRVAHLSPFGRPRVLRCNPRCLESFLQVQAVCVSHSTSQEGERKKKNRSLKWPQDFVTAQSDSSEP